MYEPWYSRIMALLEVLEWYLNFPATLVVNGAALSDGFREVIFRLTEL